jgi:NAD(P)-dependent dehydrogenase (short-subunit alcohol dehydrogenase family)
VVSELHRNELFSIEGRTAVVTGASGFLGRTLCETLLVNGARVVAVGRSPALLQATEDWARRFGPDTVIAERVDLHDAPAIEASLRGLAAREERIDVLVNNAHEMGPATGFNAPEGTLELAPDDQWLRNLAGGVLWPAAALRHLGDRLKESRGSIVNIASMYALVAPSPQLYSGTDFRNPPGYSAAKAGMLALTRYAAAWWGPHGVRANAILPGPFSNTETDGPNAVGEADPFLDRLRDRTTLGRFGAPSELAGALLFLASGASSYVTGHGLVVDGGWTIT